MRCASFCALLACMPGVLLAYNRPTDTAGPLTVRSDRSARGAYGAGGFVGGVPGSRFKFR